MPTHAHSMSIRVNNQFPSNVPYVAILVAQTYPPAIQNHSLSTIITMFSRTVFYALSILQLQIAFVEGQLGLPHEVLNVQNVTSSSGAAESGSNKISTTTVYITEPYQTPTTTRTIHSVIFPSPGASPIEITVQSQVITSYIPEMTWCVGPALFFDPVTGPPYLNATTSYKQSFEGTGSCGTAFAPIQTTVCATTLTGLGSKISVTDCDQEITFSTECGFTLETPTPITTALSSLITPAPTLKRMFTYWLAPWQALTAGETPSDVDVKVCTVLDDDGMECIRYQEVWEVVVVTSTLTTQRTIQISTTVSGPGTLIIETMQSTITDTVESIDLSTVLMLETEVETESISSGRKPTATIQSTSEVTTTFFITKHLHHVPSSTDDPTTTVWVTSTSTQRVTGTITMAKPRPRPRKIAFMPEDF